MSKFVNWLLEPFVEDLFEEAQEEVTEVVATVKDKKLYRPSTFQEYIGQKKAKEILTNYISGCRNRGVVFPHTLIQGIPGAGKTTLANILIHYLGGPYISCIGSEIPKSYNFINDINRLNGGQYYIDEIHAVERNIVEKLYPIMEDFKDVSPFTLIGSTTELGEMIKDREPFVDRFKILIELEKYTIEELVFMATQYKQKLFSNETLPNTIYLALAENCRNTPRILLRLLEATIYFEGDIYKVFKSFGILYKGITIKDLKILEYIESSKTGVGLNSIANYSDTSQENYLYSIEPFLLQSGFIVRTGRGRKITELGKQIIETLLKIR
jgi:holliday junction DNA helicase RuvB